LCSLLHRSACAPDPLVAPHLSLAHSSALPWFRIHLSCFPGCPADSRTLPRLSNKSRMPFAIVREPFPPSTSNCFPGGRDTRAAGFDLVAWGTITLGRTSCITSASAQTTRTRARLISLCGAFGDALPPLGSNPIQSNQIMLVMWSTRAHLED
jgi:hypothetical protein